VRYADNGEAVSWLRKNGRAGDLVLLKASRRYRLEEIVEGLRAPHAVG
jgi:UDP-N-acetylmuramyl pentapeptide synthase